MATVFDTAAYILEKMGPVSTVKLQKLCYYSQAWNLVWDEKPLFEEEIQGWVNGPVAPVLFRAYKGKFSASECPEGDSSKLTADEKETIDAVLDFYGGYTGAQLSELTHSELPWKEARKGLDEMEHGTEVIDLTTMEDYYSKVRSNG